MIATWYAIVSLMLIIYVVLDGRNFGAGMLHWFVAKTPEERRQVIAAIGPLWSWHEVWLVGFGGTLVAVFPRLMASAFAGYYLALFLILWCLILRGISLEVGGHINDRLWQQFWDFLFVFSNFLLAILFGAAAGNLARGVPLGAHGDFSMAFFTDFNVRGNVGLLDWYTVSIAVLAAVMLAAHGATYLTLKTEGPVHDRSAVYAKYLWAAVVPLLFVVLVESRVVRPDLPGRAIYNPFRLRLYFDFRPDESAGNAGLPWIDIPHRRPIGHRKRSHFSGDASFDSLAGEFHDCLRCGSRAHFVTSRRSLVADCSGADTPLCCVHLPTLRRQSQRPARQSSLVRPGPHSNEAGGSQLRHAPTFMTRQNAILNDNRVRYNRKEALWLKKINPRNQSIR